MNVFRSTASDSPSDPHKAPCGLYVRAALQGESSPAGRVLQRQGLEFLRGEGWNTARHQRKGSLALILPSFILVLAVYMFNPHDSSGSVILKHDSRAEQATGAGL